MLVGNDVFIEICLNPLVVGDGPNEPRVSVDLVNGARPLWKTCAVGIVNAGMNLPAQADHWEQSVIPDPAKPELLCSFAPANEEDVSSRPGPIDAVPPGAQTVEEER